MSEANKYAKKFVDELVQLDGLDTGATMHRTIENKVSALLSSKNPTMHHQSAASDLVDQLIREDKLDVGATMHRKIEARLLRLLQDI